MKDNIVEVTVKQGDKKATVFQGELDVENESLLVEIDPDCGYGGHGEAVILDNTKMGDFGYRIFNSQEDLISFIKGFSIIDGDTLGNKYFMSLELDFEEGKPIWKLQTVMASTKMRKTTDGKQ